MHGFGCEQIHLEEAGTSKAVAAEIAVATLRRTDSRNCERGTIVRQASAGQAEGDARNKGRSCAAAHRGARLRSAEVESRVGTGDYVVGPAGGNLNDGSYREAAEEASCEAVAHFALRALENSAGNPAMALVIDGVGALEEREARILGLERRLQVRGIVNGMRVRVAGEQLEGTREALGEIKDQGVVPGVGVGERGIDAVAGSDESGGDGVSVVTGNQFRICRVDVDGAMQMQAAGVLIAEAEFPGAGDFTFDCEIALLRVTVLEIARDGQSEGKNGQREASGQIVLIGKERTGRERIEAL